MGIALLKYNVSGHVLSAIQSEIVNKNSSAELLGFVLPFFLLRKNIFRDVGGKRVAMPIHMHKLHSFICIGAKQDGVE